MLSGRLVSEPPTRCFIEVVRGGDRDLASYLRIEERELETGGPN